MAFWHKWFPQPVEKDEEEEKEAILSFQIDGENLIVRCEWAPPNSDEQAFELAKKYALLIYMVTNGKLVAHIEQAVSNFENNNKYDKKVAKLILSGIQHVVRKHLGGDNKPLVSPMEAFSVRGGEDD